MITLSFTWDIIGGQEQECFQLVISELFPLLSRFGVDITDAWYTQAGPGPDILLSGRMIDQAAATYLLESDEFTELKTRLLGLSEGLQQRISPVIDLEDSDD